MEHIRNWIAAVGMEVVREAVGMVREAQRMVAAAYLVVAVGSLAVVVSNLVAAVGSNLVETVRNLVETVQYLAEVVRKLAAAVAGQSHVLVARSPEVVVVVAGDTGGFVVIVEVPAEYLVDVFLGVPAEDLVAKMFADSVVEAAYAAVQAANFAVLVVKSIAEAYKMIPTKTAASLLLVMA